MTAAESIADHGARITNVEKEQSTLAGKIDKLLFLIIGTLATSSGSLLVILLKH